MSIRVFKFVSSIVFGAIILLAIGGYFFVRNFDLNKYKSYVEEIVEEQIGRKLRINGEAKIAISLIPTIVANDIELANAEWAKEPQMIKIKQAEIKFALMPLLKKEIVIDKINIVAPEIYLEKSVAGDDNWSFKTLKLTDSSENKLKTIDKSVTIGASAAPLLAGFVAKNIDIHDGVIKYFDEKSANEIIINIANVAVSVPDYNANVNMKFDVIYNQQKIVGKTEFGSLEQLLNSEDAFPFWISATVFGVDISANGSVIDIASSPRYAAEINIYNPAANYNLPETTLKTNVDGDLKELNAKINTLNIVNNNITGNILLRWNEKVPYIEANLNSDKINLKNFNQQSPFALKKSGFINEAYALSFVPNNKIPYDLLYKINAKLKLKLNELIIVSGMSAKDIDTDVLIKDGTLIIDPLELEFGGGKIDAMLNVKAADKSIKLNANSKNMLVQNLYNEFVVTGSDDFGIKSGGVLDLDIDLVSNGDSYRELSQNLKGRIIAIVGKSEVQTGALQFLRSGFISQLLSVLNIKTKDNPNLDMTCAVLRADFNNGKADFPKGIVIDSKQLTMVGDGNINLINDKIDFTIEPQFNKLMNGNLSQALASFVKVVGTVQNPKIKLDDTEALKTIVGVVASGGATYLGSQVLAYGGGEPCYVALQGTSYASRFPKPTGVINATKNVYKDTSEQIKKGIEGLQNTAKDILNMFTNP